MPVNSNFRPFMIKNERKKYIYNNANKLYFNVSMYFWSISMINFYIRIQFAFFEQD